MPYKGNFHKKSKASSFVVASACLLATCLVSGCSEDSSSTPEPSSNISTSTPPPGQETTPTASNSASMDASVSFVTASDNIDHPGEQFRVQNNNDYDWHEVSLTILVRRGNGKIGSEDFTKKAVTIPAHTAYFALMKDFVGEDTGRHFDPQWFLDPDLRARYFVSGSTGGVQFEINATGPNNSQEYWGTAESQNSDVPEHVGQ